MKKMDPVLVPIILTVGALGAVIVSWVQYFNEKTNRQTTALYQKQAQSTIDSLRTESLENALGSDQVYLFVDKTNSHYVSLYNSSDLPAFELAIQVWDQDKLAGCNIKEVNGSYIIDRTCYDQLNMPRYFQVLYGDSHHDSKIPIVSNKIVKFRAHVVCRRGKYYVDMYYVPGKGSVTRKFQYISGVMTNIEIYNPYNIDISWEKEFTLPVVFNF